MGMMSKSIVQALSPDTEQEKWGEVSHKNTDSITTKPSAKWPGLNLGEYPSP